MPAQAGPGLRNPGQGGQRLGQRARGLRMQAANRLSGAQRRRGVRGPGGEQREQLVGRLRPGAVARGEVAAPQLEQLAQRLRHRLAFELLLVALQQTLADAQHERGAAVEALHHLFDRQALGIVAVAQARGEGFLLVEAQALLALARHEVQPEPQPRQRAALAFERGVLVGAELAERQQ